jgi:hypothetical protein
MKQTRISKVAKVRAAGEPIRWADDPRDADVVLAKALARARSGSVEANFRSRAA